MSNEKDIDREAALAQLTDEERAALEEDDLTDEEKSTLKDIAGEDGDDEDDEDDEDDDGDDEPAASTDSKKAAKVEDPAPETGATDEDGDEFRPVYRAELPADFDDKVKALDDREADLAKQFKDGGVEMDAFLAESKRIAEERRKLDLIRVQADLASGMEEQTAAQRWAWTVQRFKRTALKAEGIDYSDDESEVAQDLNSFVKVLAENPKNANKPMEFFLDEAHKRVKALHGIGKKETKPAEESKPADKKASRKPALDKLPATLAHVPGADGPGDVSDEFTELDKLDGLEYETALRKLSPEQRDRYLQAA